MHGFGTVRAPAFLRILTRQIDQLAEFKRNGTGPRSPVSLVFAIPLRSDSTSAACIHRCASRREILHAPNVRGRRPSPCRCLFRYVSGSTRGRRLSRSLRTCCLIICPSGARSLRGRALREQMRTVFSERSVTIASALFSSSYSNHSRALLERSTEFPSMSVKLQKSLNNLDSAPLGMPPDLGSVMSDRNVLSGTCDLRLVRVHLLPAQGQHRFVLGEKKRVSARARQKLHPRIVCLAKTLRVCRINDLGCGCAARFSLRFPDVCAPSTSARLGPLRLSRPRRTPPGEPRPSATTAGSARKTTSPASEFSRQAVLGRSPKSLVGLEEIADPDHA